MTLPDDIYRRIADKITDSIEFDHFAGDGEIDVDKTSFVTYEFHGEGRMIDYYAADYINPCQYDVAADVSLQVLYVTEDGETPIDNDHVSWYLSKNIKIN